MGRAASTTRPSRPKRLDSLEARRLQQVVGRLSRLVRAQTSAGLTPSQLTCLAGIVRDGPLPVSDLASRDSMNPTALSRVVARLVEAGLVTRAPDPTDRRVGLLAATRKGRSTLDHVRADRTALIVDRVATLPPEHVDALLAALPALEALGVALADRGEEARPTP